MQCGRQSNAVKGGCSYAPARPCHGAGRAIASAPPNCIQHDCRPGRVTPQLLTTGTMLLSGRAALALMVVSWLLPPAPQALAPGVPQALVLLPMVSYEAAGVSSSVGHAGEEKGAEAGTILTAPDCAACGGMQLVGASSERLWALTYCICCGIELRCDAGTCGVEWVSAARYPFPSRGKPA